MIYASRTPSATTECANTEYHQAHPANPVLVAFREYGEAGAALWLETLNGYSSTYDYVDVVDDAIDAATPEQIDHARRVLTRLANFTKEQSA